MKIYELLRTKKQYCHEYVAVDRDGDPVEPYDPNAVAWSLIGAIIKCYPGDTAPVMKKIKERTGFVYIALYEDVANLTEIRKLLKELDV